MRVMGVRRVVVSALAVAAACRSPARVRLVDATPGACGQALDETNLKVTAYTPSGEQSQAIPPGGAVTIDDFPGDTEQLGIEVLGSGGVTALAGKTAPVDFAALADGAALPVFVAPPDGFCSVGALHEARAQPLVALAGDGVLVVGGTGSAGPSNTAERYDYATASFVTVPVPPVLVDPDNGLAGGVLTSLPDGRVALTGTSSRILMIYDPGSGAFGEPVAFDKRVFHGAIALDEDHLLVAGGCLDVASGACSDLQLISSEVYDIADLANLTSVPGPTLTEGTSWIGASLYDTGADYVLAGGSGTFGVADELVPTATNATAVTGLRGAYAPLDGGAMLSADTGGVVVIPPGAATAVPVPLGATDGSDTLVALEDGRVLGIGSDRERYDPTTEAWTAVPPAGDDPGPLAGATALRLPDGSVLVLGASPATTSAWVYRPSLVGPSAGSVIVLPGSGSGGVMTAVDPSTLAVDGYHLTANATDLDARALVGGTRMAIGTLVVTATVGSGGVALIGRQVAPGDALVARLAPGQPAEIDDLASATTLCTGPPVAAFAAGVDVQLELDVDASSATLLRDSAIQVTCSVAGGARGAWGVAPLGGTMSVLTATVTR
jgi:hypothetical protein